MVSAPRPPLTSSPKSKLEMPRQCRVAVPLPIMRDVSARVRRPLLFSIAAFIFSFVSKSTTVYTIVARIHASSEHTPLCSSCGLVLCALQFPHRPCPHCTTPLLTPSARVALIAQLEELRVFALKKEVEAHEREAEELRLAEGAFPALWGSGSGGGGAAVGVRGEVRGEGREMVVVVDSVIVCFWWIRERNTSGSSLTRGRARRRKRRMRQQVSMGRCRHYSACPRHRGKLSTCMCSMGLRRAGRI